MTFKLYFMAVADAPFFNRKNIIVMDGVMTLHASNQVLCNK